MTWSENIYLTDVLMMVWGVMANFCQINHTSTPKWKSSLQTLVSVVKHPMQSYLADRGRNRRKMVEVRVDLENIV